MFCYGDKIVGRDEVSVFCDHANQRFVMRGATLPQIQNRLEYQFEFVVGQSVAYQGHPVDGAAQRHHFGVFFVE